VELREFKKEYKLKFFILFLSVNTIKNTYEELRRIDLEIYDHL
jgi:hypothetical protein